MEKEKRKIRLLYSCDAWLSYASMELLAVFTTAKQLQKYLKGMKRAKLLDDYDFSALLNEKQTQCKETNYIIEEHNPNPKFKK